MSKKHAHSDNGDFHLRKSFKQICLKLHEGEVPEKAANIHIYTFTAFRRAKLSQNHCILLTWLKDMYRYSESEEQRKPDNG